MADPAAAPAASAPSPAPTPSPSPAPSPAPAPGPAPSPAPGPAPSPSPAPAPSGKAADDTGDKPGYWPEDWRQTVSAADEKVLTRLQRYASPADVAKALIAAQNKISAGELKPVLGKDAKPEEVAEYRKALGIPETADKYELKDVKVDDADKPFVAELLKAAHLTNQTPDQVAANVKTWNAIKEAAFAKRAEDDHAVQKTSEDALRAEWGTEFRRNINLVHGLLDGAGSDSVKDSLLSGRLADGTPIGSSPAVLKMLLGLALVQNPAGFVAPGGGYNQKGMNDRIAEIEKMMREDRKAYNDPKISGPDGEYTRLIAAREQVKAREKA